MVQEELLVTPGGTTALGEALCPETGWASPLCSDATHHAGSPTIRVEAASV